VLHIGDCRCVYYGVLCAFYNVSYCAAATKDDHCIVLCIHVGESLRLQNEHNVLLHIGDCRCVF
jgi:hypothetical protein